MNKFNHSSLLTPDVWNNYELPIKNKIFTIQLLSYYLSKFWKDIMEKIDNKYIIILLRVQYLDDTISTLGNLQKINVKNYNELYEIFKDLINWKGENYKIREIKNIFFSYKIIPEDKLIINKSKLVTDEKLKITNKLIYNFTGWNLPNTIDYKLWGNILYYISNKIIHVNDFSNKYLYKIYIKKDHNEIHLLNLKTNNLIIKFYDYPMDVNNLSIFRRIINNHIYYYKDNKLILKTLNRETSFLTSIEKDNKINNKFITLDIETKTINNVMIPYCICIFDGINKLSFYLNDYKDYNDMLIHAIYSLLKRKYTGYKVYIHNLSNFDGIFILKILSSIENIFIKPIIKDNKIIEIKIIFGKYNIAFRDSYLMLPSSLSKLTKQFNVSNKTIFPYNFINDKFNNNINLNYIGKVPGIKYFINLTLDQYNEYKQNFLNNWSLKNETINYCLQDCISLYQVIDKFNTLIFNKFNLNVNNFPTLPSLAFGIYRAHYLKDYKIPLIIGQIFNDIKLSYTGGSTDMFKPFGENIFRYDVNSLYPYVMKTFLMPVGNIKFFEGNILDIEPNAFGFFKCIITAPKDIKHPILQTKFDTGNGIRTLSPVGTWTDILFSEEMFNAMKYGYKFEILSGYTFDKEYIFNDYVSELYEIKQSHSKDDPMYLISKLLLNSLYGRFGMDYKLNKHIFIDNNELYDYIDNYTIENIIPLNNNLSLISYLDNNKYKNILLSKDSKNNISISIASAISAYARIHMSQFKNNSDYDLYYSDTDSIDINKPLPSNFIGKELGKMKLEYNFIEATFLAPKVYGGLYNENNQLKSITKVKGFKNNLDYYDLKSLLIKDKSLSLNQEKWFKDFENSNITIKDQLYTLVPTNNKRQLIYNNNNLIDTKPFIIENSKIIKESE